MTKSVNFDDGGLRVERDENGNTHVNFKGSGSRGHGYHHGSYHHHHDWGHHYFTPAEACIVIAGRVVGVVLFVIGITGLIYSCNSYSPSQAAANPAGIERGRLEETVSRQKAEGGVEGVVNQSYTVVRETK